MDSSPVVLDSCCGTGNVAVELLKRGHTVHAADASQLALAVLKAKCAPYSGRLRVHAGDAARLLLTNRVFDGVSSGLLPQLEREFSVFREGFLWGVVQSVVGGCTRERMSAVLNSIGFQAMVPHPNPYFGQCYSLTAQKRVNARTPAPS